MTPEPFSFAIRLDDFDVSRLPINAELLRSDPKLLGQAVSQYYTGIFKKLGGTATVAVRGGLVEVSWNPGTGDPKSLLADEALRLLRAGDYSAAEPLLKSLQTCFPDDPEILYNYGMMLSDQGRLEAATPMLQRLVELQPRNANGWTALGVAYARQQKKGLAQQSFRTALEAEPDNGYALRNAGSLLAADAPAEALPLLRKAVELLPDDQLAHYAYGQCLLALDQTPEADKTLVRCIEVAPLTEVAEKARTLRTAIGQRQMRAAVDGGLRMDVVMYCVGALQRFRDLGDAKMRATVLEIALLGRGGLDINDPAQKYTLKSLPGQFSGLHLVSLMYTGSQLMRIPVSVGIDFSREYDQAKKMFELEQNRETQ